MTARRARIPERFTKCCLCGGPPPGDYQVQDSVWASAGLKPRGGVAHLLCLERRLGRKLRREDFALVPANETLFWALDHYETGEEDAS